MTPSAIVYFDGGARPNPGLADIGYIVETDDSTEKESHHIGESTNIKAEYHALIQGLETAPEKGCTVVEAKGDLELVVKQVRGEWSVNESELHPLHNRVQELAEGSDQFRIKHIPRQENWKADELVEQAFSN